MVKKRASIQPPIPFYWPRADPLALASFDLRSKICVMNCGPSTDDPRSDRERLFLCDECLTPSGEPAPFPTADL